jgi:hypothetical protein
MPVVSESAFVDREVGIVEFLLEEEHRGHGIGLSGILALALTRIASEPTFTAHKRRFFQRQYATLRVRSITRNVS